MEITQSKSNLAKLLSEENVIVEQRKVKTAFFDVESRLLVIPSFKKELSENVTDLLISHEVGHALYTPYDEFGDALKSGIDYHILNVVEDSRIERLVKNKYPGLKSIYAKGYKELLDIDFFGLKELDINVCDLNLIDRINLYCKVGFIQGLSFTDEESSFLERIENTKTYSEVVQLTKEIMNYLCKKFLENKDELDLPDDPENIDEEGSMYFGNNNGNNETSESKETENFDNLSEEEKNELANELAKDILQSGNILPDKEDIVESKFSKEFIDLVKEKIKSITQEYSEEVLTSLLIDENRQSIYIDLPDINIEEIIIDNNKIIKDIDEMVRYINSTYAQLRTVNFSDFRKECNSSVNYLVKEFLLMKNAQGRKRTKVSKTGDLNMNKIYSYQVNDDIFKKMQKIPKEQSHGLVFFLDWSSSMQYYMQDTIKQLIAMTLFCNKVNIPYEVYAFTTSYDDRNQLKRNTNLKQNQAVVTNFNLLHFLSSKMSNSNYNKVCDFLLNYTRYSIHRINKNYMLGSTPLNHTILLSPEVINLFKRNNKVQIINAIFMTDGESHQVAYKHKEYEVGGLVNYKTNVYLRNLKEKISWWMKPPPVSLKGHYAIPTFEMDNCINFIKQYSDFRIFGFRLINIHEFKKSYSINFYSKNSNEMFDDLVKEFNKNSIVKRTVDSFDEFYFIKTSFLSETFEMENIKETETQNSIVKKFKKSVAGKINNKIFLKKFIDFIS